MNTAQSTDNSARAGTLSVEHNAALLDHLRAEEEVLAVLLDAVRATWQSLAARNDDQLDQALEAEARGFQLCELMRDRRRQFCGEVAGSLNLSPEQVTLSRLLVGASQETRQQALQFRHRLTEMSAELARLNRQNAAMIRQSLDLTRSIIGELTGQGPHFESYNASGKSEAVHVGPVLQWGG